MLDAAPGGGTAFLFFGSHGDACLILSSIGHGMIMSLSGNGSKVLSWLDGCNCLMTQLRSDGSG